MIPAQQDVERRQHKDGEQGSDTQSGADGQTNGKAAFRARANGNQQRHHGKDQRQGRHDDWPQADRCRLNHRIHLVKPAFLLQLVGELDNQDAVLGHHPDQRYQTHLGVDVHGGEAEDDERHGSGNRHGHRHQNDERIPPAFELGCQHQVNHQQREEEGHHQGAALGRQLAGLASVVVTEALWENFSGGLLHEVHGGTCGYARLYHAFKSEGVLLVELGAVRGFNVRAEADDAAQRHQFVVIRANVILIERLSIQPELLVNLRNHLVRAALHAETIDVTAPKHARQALANVLHGQTQVRYPVPVDVDACDRPIKVDGFLQEHEVTAAHGFAQQFIRNLIQLLIAAAGGNHELEWQATAGARQGRPREHGGLQAAYVLELGIQLWLDFKLTDLPLTPGRQLETTEYRIGAGNADDHKVLIVARDRRHTLLDFIAMLQKIVKGRGLGAKPLIEQDALVFSGSQLVLAH